MRLSSSFKTISKMSGSNNALLIEDVYKSQRFPAGLKPLQKLEIGKTPHLCFIVERLREEWKFSVLKTR